MVRVPDLAGETKADEAPEHDAAERHDQPDGVGFATRFAR